MRYLGYLFLVLLLVAAGSGCGSRLGGKHAATTQLETPPEIETEPTALTPEQRYIRELLAQKGLKGSNSTVLLVHKQARKLTVYKGLTPLRTYPVVLGNDPYNDKLCQGDACTPEGVFGIRAKYPHPRWDCFIWLDYPNTQDWLKFSQAKKAGKVPWNADIGGQIGIHGTEDPLKNLAGLNWTKGCISLLNRDLDEIYPLVNARTLVVIRK